MSARADDVLRARARALYEAIVADLMVRATDLVRRAP
jgi:hypothetical protein